MIHTLYGDGIHDDTDAIQEMIDLGGCEVCLPAPKNFYLISRTLLLPSNIKFVLPRFAEIRLAPSSNCLMLTNKLEKSGDEELNYSYKDYVKSLSCAPSSENIELIGGIWNFNNMEQNQNPFHVKEPRISGYWGFGILFYKVNNLKISSLTLKDPVTFGLSFDTVSYFTAEDIIFDQNHGNYLPINMDGIHVFGNCHYGVIRNLKGTCYDDLVALNADEGSCGPITNIEVDGIFSEGCHSGVRLLNVCQEFKNIHISNIFGTYFQYCIGITKNTINGKIEGFYDAITINNIYASKAQPICQYPWQGDWQFPFIYIDCELYVKNIRISSLHRREQNIPKETIGVWGAGTVVENMVLEDFSVENHTGVDFPLIRNNGTIKNLTLIDVGPSTDIENLDDGTVENTNIK